MFISIAILISHHPLIYNNGVLVNDNWLVLGRHVGHQFLSRAG